MSIIDNKTTRDHFSAMVRSVTPESARHICQVWYAPVSRDPEVTRLCTSVLSGAERMRADRFADEKDQALFRQRRAFRRFCGAAVLGSPSSLSDVNFQETGNGRPFLSQIPGTWFSFSSCSHGFLAAWSSSHGLGVDIETPAENIQTEELAQQYYAAAEMRAVLTNDSQLRVKTFYQLWCLKEAALKSIDEGLPYGLDRFEFEMTPKPRVIDAPVEFGGQPVFSAAMIDRTPQYAALVTRSLA